MNTTRFIAALLGPLTALLGQQPAAPEAQGVIRVTSKEVLVDVVVRDRKGRFLHKLTARDFAVTDDGVVQKIIGFREVSGGAGAVPAPGEASASTSSAAPQRTADLARPTRLVSFVFDKLSVDSRRVARQGALDMLKNELEPNTYYGVFFIDQRLRVVQAFCRDRALLRAAVERATGIGASDFANDNTSLKQASDQTSGSDGAAAATASSAASSRGAAAVDGGGMANEAMGKMVDSMLSFSTELSREQEGRSSILSLFAVIREQIRMPGRKALIYFSEGIQLPNSLWSQFQAMISAANRANVSVYAVDARGVRIESDQIGSSAMLKSATVTSYRQATTVENVAVQRKDVMVFDQALDSLRANAQAVLGELAEGTGGALIANTNDVRVGLRRVADELDSHYEISYQAGAEIFDGRFHAIDVKLDRADAQVQARNGYYSLPTLDGQAVYPYEVPLLNAVAKSPLPRAFEFRSAVLRFRPKDGGTMQSSLVFDLPLKDITFAKNDEKKVYKTHLSLMALVKDASGHVVAKLSRDVPFEEPIDKLAGFQQGRLIVTRALSLAPGRYTVETAVADREGNKISAKRSALVIPAATPGVALSEITLIRRFEKAPDDPEPEDPFINGKSRIVPTLLDTVPGGKGTALSLFFAVYPESGAPPPTMLMEFLQDGKLVAQGAPELPTADARGVIPYIANSPLENFKSGQYEVRVTVTQGSHAARQSMFVNIE